MELSDFEKYVTWLRSDDTSIYEDGFHSIKGHVDEVLNELIALASQEHDGFMKEKFVELIGDSQDAKAVEFLIAELDSKHKEVREWAYSFLVNSSSALANSKAKRFAGEHPNEEFL